MTRLLLVLACFAVASAAFAAPVPKTIRPDPIRLSGPRPLIVCMAEVEDGELKLSRLITPRRPDTLDTRSCPLAKVTATEKDGKPVTPDRVKARLKKPAFVIVTPFEPVPAHASDAPKVDAGDDWRRVLADDVIVIDGEPFKFGWQEGFYDVRLDPVRVEGLKVTTTWLGHAGGKWGSHAFQQDRVRDPDELLDVDAREWEKWVRWNKQRGVEIDFQHGKRAPKEHQNVFRDYYLGSGEPHYSIRSSSPLQELAGNPFKPR